MKPLSIIAVSFLLALSASAAQAFTPPYHPHPGSAQYIGTLSINSTGSCKIKKVYENAVYTNDVRDSANALVGAGLISADGEQLLAVRGYSQLVSGFYRASTGVDYQLWFNDMNSLATTAALSALSGCAIVMDNVITSPKSWYIWSYKTGSYDNVTIDYRFNGFLPATLVVEGSNETWQPHVFKGRILFKGKRSI